MAPDDGVLDTESILGVMLVSMMVLLMMVLASRVLRLDGRGTLNLVDW